MILIQVNVKMKPTSLTTSDLFFDFYSPRGARNSTHRTNDSFPSRIRHNLREVFRKLAQGVPVPVASSPENKSFCSSTCI